MSKNRFSVFQLNSPSTKNAFDLEMSKDLIKTAARAVSDGKIGLIITSSDLKVFCSGGNLKNYDLGSKSKSVDVNRLIRKNIEKLQSLPILTIAAVEGLAVGGGCELALGCDLIFAGENSKFCFRQAEINITTGWSGGGRLLKRVGSGVALDFLLSSRQISNEEALKSGLVDRVCKSSETSNEAIKFLNQVVASVEVIGAYKKMITNPKSEDLNFERLWFNEKHRNYIRGFLKK